MTNIQEQNRKKGGRPPTGRVRKLSKSVTVKFSKPSYEALKLRARKPTASWRSISVNQP